MQSVWLFRPPNWRFFRSKQTSDVYKYNDRRRPLTYASHGQSLFDLSGAHPRPRKIVDSPIRSEPTPTYAAAAMRLNFRLDTRPSSPLSIFA